jgi:acetolactate synthase-1/3 small subunit
MPTPAHDHVADSGFAHEHAVLELTVHNHPGVMSHICGLFARRAFNLSGILCMPLAGREHSRIWLLIEGVQMLDQMVKQVSKLEDVLEVRNRTPDKKAFSELERLFSLETPESNGNASTRPEYGTEFTETCT